MRLPRKVLGALGVGALVAGTWFTGPTFAQSDEGGTDETTEQTDEADGRHRPGRTAFKEALAEELGISVEELEEAMANAKEQVQADFVERCEERRDEVRDNLVDRLRDRVADGELTEDEARDILDRFDERDCEDGPPHRDGRRGPRFRGGFDGPPVDGPDESVTDAVLDVA